MSVELKGSHSEGGESREDGRETYVSCYNPVIYTDLVLPYS